MCESKAAGFQDVSGDLNQQPDAPQSGFLQPEPTVLMMRRFDLRVLLSHCDFKKQIKFSWWRPGFENWSPTPESAV